MQDAGFEREILMSDIGAYRPYKSADGATYVTLRNPITGVKEMVEYTGDETVWSKEEWIQIDRLVNEEFCKHTPLLSALFKSKLQFECTLKSCFLLNPVLPVENTQGSEDIEGTFVIKEIPLRIRWVECNAIARTNKANLFSIRRLMESAKKLAETVECVFCNALLVAAKHDADEKIYTVSESQKVLAERRYYGPYGVCVPTVLDNKGNEVDVQYDNAQTIQSPQCESAVIFQMTPDVIRAIVGLWVTTIMYSGNFRIVCCIAPQVRSDYKGKYGILCVR